jgi:threonine efflux protein
MLATLLTVALLHWVILVTPGVNFFVVSHLAASGHRRSACHAALGVSVVTITWALLAVLGVDALFDAHPQIRLTMQVAGGGYLCCIAVGLWRSNASTADQQTVPLAPLAAFRLGFLTNILNPKSALFFGSVFVTALPSAPSVSLLVAMVVLVFLNTLIWHTLLAIAFSNPRVQSGYARQRKILSRVAGAIVGAFGLRLIAETAGELRAR